MAIDNRQLLGDLERIVPGYDGQRIPWAEIARDLQSQYRDKSITRKRLKSLWDRESAKQQQPRPAPVALDIQPTDASEDDKTYQNDGSIISRVVQNLKAKKAFTQEELLKLHGFDPKQFRIRSVVSNSWTTPIDGGSYYNYQSKIHAEPLTRDEIDWDEISERLLSKIRPRSEKLLTATEPEPPRYLVVSLFDVHMGINSYDGYRSTISRITNLMDRGYSEIVIISGGDLLHENDYRGQTASGTQIGITDMSQAWEDAFDLMDTLLDAATDAAPLVTLMYVPGNHDEFSAHTVVKALRRMWSETEAVTIDDTQDVYKARLIGHNFVAATHGDKSSFKQYPQLFATNHARLWGADGVSNRELFVGHLHHERVLDTGGLLIRQAPTRAAADQWTRDQGYDTSHRRFMCVEYSERETTAVHYV